MSWAAAYLILDFDTFVKPLQRKYLLWRWQIHQGLFTRIYLGTEEREILSYKGIVCLFIRLRKTNCDMIAVPGKEYLQCRVFVDFFLILLSYSHQTLDRQTPNTQKYVLNRIHLLKLILFWVYKEYHFTPSNDLILSSEMFQFWQKYCWLPKVSFYLILIKIQEKLRLTMRGSALA